VRATGGVARSEDGRLVDGVLAGGGVARRAARLACNGRPAAWDGSRLPPEHLCDRDVAAHHVVPGVERDGAGDALTAAVRVPTPSMWSRTARRVAAGPTATTARPISMVAS
jgi:hypothetical protein